MTEVSRNKSNIQSAAPEPFCEGSEARLAKASSRVSGIISWVMDMDLLLPDRKSEMAQKKVMV